MGGIAITHHSGAEAVSEFARLVWPTLAGVRGRGRPFTGSPGERVVLALDGGGAVGWVRWVPRPGGTGSVIDIGTVPGRRGEGIGTAMVLSLRDGCPGGLDLDDVSEGFWASGGRGAWTSVIDPSGFVTTVSWTGRDTVSTVL